MAALCSGAKMLGIVIFFVAAIPFYALLIYLGYKIFHDDLG
jgi:hypothetical protein